MNVYQGYASQSGRGLGNVLGGLFRAAIPVLGKTAKNIAKYAGRTLLQTGMDHLNMGAKRAIDRLSEHEPVRKKQFRNTQPVNRITKRAKKTNKKLNKNKGRPSRRLTSQGRRPVQDIFS